MFMTRNTDDEKDVKRVFNFIKQLLYVISKIDSLFAKHFREIRNADVMTLFGFASYCRSLVDGLWLSGRFSSPDLVAIYMYYCINFQK